jgi:hypothetical protein
MCCSQERCPFIGVKECGIDGPKCEHFTPFMPLRNVKVISPEGIIQIGQMDQYQNIYGIGIPFEHLAHEGYQVEEM